MKKIIVNKCYGGFRLKKNILKKLTKDEYAISEDFREDKRLIDIIETFGPDAVQDDKVSDLVVVTMPDGTTDYDVEEYDGFETLIYVVNGKLYRA